ncbi:MAG: hypothetical protein FK733_01940 [Asgard group archaeon]|nr:hypothetical protein [Asgard group archaeon]
MPEEKKKTEQETETILEEEVEEDTVLEENIEKIEALIEELNKFEDIKDPNIRICPRCFSVRVKMEDMVANLGIGGSYPTCRCLDCGWTSKKWIYLDRTLTKEEREEFFREIINEKVKK